MITDLMNDLDDRVQEAFTEKVEIRDVDEFPSLNEMYVEKRVLLRVLDVVCVVADLKGSTKLNFDKYGSVVSPPVRGLNGQHGPDRQPFRPRIRGHPGRRPVLPIPRGPTV